MDWKSYSLAISRASYSPVQTTAPLSAVQQQGLNPGGRQTKKIKRVIVFVHFQLSIARRMFMFSNIDVRTD